MLRRNMEALKASIRCENSGRFVLDLSWVEEQNRRVFHFRDSTPIGVRMRAAVNCILRNPGNGPLRKFELRRHQPGGAYRVNSECPPIPRALVVALLGILKREASELQTAITATNLGALKEDVDNVLLSKSVRAEAHESIKQTYARQATLKEVKFLIAMCECSLKYVGPLAPANFAGAVENARPMAGTDTGLTGMPVAVPSSQGITLSVFSSDTKLPEEVANYIVSQTEYFMSKGHSLAGLTVLAPMEAVTEEGRLLPLFDQKVAGDTYSVQEELILYAKNKLPRGYHPRVELRAWQWLILSHNQVSPGKARVPIASALKVCWSDPLNIKRKAKAIKGKSDSALRDRLAVAILAIDEMASEGGQVDTASLLMFLKEALTGDAADKEKPTEVTSEEEEKQEIPDAPDAEPALPEASSSDTVVEEEVEGVAVNTDLPPPFSVHLDGRPFRAVQDEDFYKDLDGQIAQMAVFKVDGQYTVYVGVPEAAVLDSEKAKLTLKAPAPARPKKESAVKGKSPSKPKTSHEAVRKEPSSRGKKKPPTSDEDGVGPLNIKGEPLSARLTSDQRKSLRSFFKLKNSAVPADEWSKLSKKEKTAAREEMAIPRWAVTAVIQRPDNLEKIVKGSLTKEKFSQSSKSAKPPSKRGTDRKTGNRSRSRDRRGRSESPRRGRGKSTKTTDVAQGLKLLLRALLE